MLGEPVVAADALEIGLTNPWSRRRRCCRRRARWRRRLARRPAVRARHDQGDAQPRARHGLEEALEAEAQAQQICMATRDFREAYEAFVAKREPKFEGR